MSPSQRAERDRAIDEALRYWSIERLSEIFSEIYAAFACGPAYYFSCVDMALKLTSDPFFINPVDVHPPPAARVCVCHEAVAPVYHNEPFIISTRNVWDSYAQLARRNAQFELFCADALLKQLAEVATQDIKKVIPEIRPYEEPLVADSEIEQIPSGTSLENILNRAGKILLTRPDRYGDWEKEVIKILNLDTASRIRS